MSTDFSFEFLFLLFLFLLVVSIILLPLSAEICNVLLDTQFSKSVTGDQIQKEFPLRRN